MLKTYYEIRSWLESFIPYTYSKENLGLERIEYLLKLLGNPEKKFKSIHVGGTSGKGSTAFHIARLLQFSGPVSRFPPASARSRVKSNGNQKDNVELCAVGIPSTTATRKLKIGLHLSPHLVYIGERMQIFSSAVVPAKAGTLTKKKILDQVENDNSFIPMKRFIGLVNAIKPFVEQMEGSQVGKPSYFEILVASSFKYFADSKVDFAVVEVGLGGTFDATNVLQPEISVITNVGLDHTEILGDSIEKIAEEKAGIIKKNVPIVTGATGKALQIIEKAARLASALLIVLDNETRWTKAKKSKLITLDTRSIEKSAQTAIFKFFSIYKETLRDIHAQLAFSNKLLAIAAVSELKIKLDKQIAKKAFSKSLAGRFEIIDRGVILDGAHNVDKVRFLIHFVRDTFLIRHSREGGNLDPRLRKDDMSGVVLVLAFKKGKDWKKMVDLLVKNLPVKKVIATKFYAVTDTGKFAAVEPEEIAKYVSSIKYKVLSIETYDNSQEAVFEAVNLAGSTSEVKISHTSEAYKVLITGSLYLVGEARTLWYLPPF